MFAKKKAMKNFARAILMGLVCGSVLGVAGGAWAEDIVVPAGETLELKDNTFEQKITVEKDGVLYVTNATVLGFTPGVQAAGSGNTYANKGTGSIVLNEGTVILTNSFVEGFVDGIGTVNISGNVTVQANLNDSGKEDYNDNGGLFSAGAMNISVADGSILKANIGADGMDAKVMVTANDVTIHGTEFAEVLCAQSGGLLQVNSEGAEQKLKIISEENDNVGLNSYINADLRVYGLESLMVTRTKENRGVNGVYASSGSNVIINTVGDPLKTTIAVKGGPMDEDTMHNASAMALYSTWYTGSGDSKVFASLTANGIKEVTAETTGLYGMAYAVYETFGSTINLNSPTNVKAEGLISAKADYYAVGITAAGGFVNVYGIKDINALATGNKEYDVVGEAIGINAYDETDYSGKNSKVFLKLNSEQADYETSIVAKSTSDDDPSDSWDACAIGVKSSREADVDLNGIKDIKAESLRMSIGIYSYGNMVDKVNDIDVDMAGTISAVTTGDSGTSVGVFSMGYSDVTVDGNSTAKINVQATGDETEAYGVDAESGGKVTLNNFLSITAVGGESVGLFASGDGTAINIIGKDADNKTSIIGDIYAQDGGTVSLTNTTINGSVINSATMNFNNVSVQGVAEGSDVIQNTGVINLIAGTYDENFVQDVKDSGTVNLKDEAVYQTVAGNVFTETDATKDNSGAVTDAAKARINFVGGTLALTDEKYSIAYLRSGQTALKEFKYDGTNLSTTKLIMLGTPVEKEITIDDLNLLGENVVLNNVEVKTDSDKANLIIGSTDTTGDYKNAVAKGFSVGSLNLGAGSEKVAVTNGQNLTLGGTEGGIIVKVDGEEKNINVTVGNGTDASALNIGNEMVDENTEIRLPGNVNVAKGSAVKVRGKTEITGGLKMDGGEVAVAEGASLKVKEIGFTDGAVNDAKVSGKVETEKLAGKSGKVITVGNNNAAGHVSAKETQLDSGILFLDPAWVNGVGIQGATHFATQTTDLDGAYVVGRNSILTFGTTNEEADALFGSTGLNWGENNITAAAYVAENINVANGSLTVDGSLTTAPAAPAKGTVNFAANSLFMVDGDNCQGGAAVTGVKSATVADSSKLFIANAISNTTYKILAGEGITSGWLEDNVVIKGTIDGLDVELAGTYFNVTTGGTGFSVPGTVMPNVAEAILNGGRSKAYDALGKMTDVPSVEQQTANVNNYANLGENLGVTRGAYDVINMTGEVITQHWNNREDGENVWAVYNHNKDKVDGLKLGGMDAKYDAQYNGVTVGYDVKKDFGVSLNHVDGNVSNGYGGHNDAKYYGISVYGKKSIGKVDIFGDVTYSHGKNELAQNGIEANAKTNSFSMGVTAKYATNIVKIGKVTPFAGVRYIRIDGKDYSDSLGVNRDAATVNSVVVPVGVEYSNIFAVPGSKWTVKPEAAIGYLFNLGDKDNSMNLRFNGGKDSFAYDFVDNGAFFTKLGASFTKKNLTLGVGYDYMKSKNSKNNRWNVSVNVTF